MKIYTKTAFPLMALFVTAVMMITPSFAEISVTIEPAMGSGTPGCEEMTDGCYIPSTATIDVGGVVIMSNTDTTIHTFTSGIVDGFATSPDGTFDSGILNADNSFEFIPDTVGEIPYFCMVHPWMQGLIIVQEAGAEEVTEDEISIDVETIVVVPSIPLEQSNSIILTVNADKQSYILWESIKVTGTADSSLSFDHKIRLSEVRVVDSFGNIPKTISIDQQIQIAADLANTQRTEQSFAYVIQILDDDGTIVSLSWITGSLNAGQSFGPSLSWIPIESGIYHGKIFIWDSISNASSLGALATFDLSVGLELQSLSNLMIENYDIAPLSLMFVSPSKNIILLDEMQPINNRFSGTYVTQGSMWKEYGVYQIKVVQGDQTAVYTFSLKDTSPEPVPDPVPEPVPDPVPEPVPDPVPEPKLEPTTGQTPSFEPSADPPDDFDPTIPIVLGGVIAAGIGIAAAKGVFTGGMGSSAGGSGSSSTSTKPSTQKPPSIHVEINYEVGFEQ